VELKKRILMIVTALGVGLGLGWVVAAQEAPAKAWKGKEGGQEEYGLAQAADKAGDPQSRLKALDEWKNRFPDTDFWEIREDYYLVTYSQLSDCRKSFDQAVEIRKRRAKHFLSLNSILTCIYQFNPPGNPDLGTAEQAARYIMDNANAVFADDNKPLTMTVEQLRAARPAIEKLSQQTYAWVFVQRKEWAKAEPELRKFLAMDGTQAGFSLYLANALLNQARVNPNNPDTAKFIEALFHFARAGAYGGQGALQGQAKSDAMNFFNSAYDTFHGSHEGADRVIQIASSSVMPPAGFSIKDVNTIRQEEYAAEQAWIASHPVEAYWRDVIRAPLTGPDGAQIWEMNFKDTGQPGEFGASKGVPLFRGTIISHTEEKGNTKSLVVGVFEPTVADATLNFLEPLPGIMEPGSTVSFKGTLKSYLPSPFMVTFELDDMDIVGWTGTKAGKGK
jgi:hypothetical protein